MNAVVIATDKFKGSLSAAEVSAALREGLLSRSPGLDVRELSVADGGEGSVAAALRAGFRPVRARVRGPLGSLVDATYAMNGRTAVIEAAQACGLHLTETRAPLSASSYGVGQLVLSALDRGARRIVLAVGGSASIDGGAGMLIALGARLTSADVEIGLGGGALSSVDSVDTSWLEPRLAAVELVLAADVSNPLTEAASVYGPQKGASLDDVQRLEAGLAKFAALCSQAFGRDAAGLPAAGAAGGLGYAAYLLGAQHRSGAEYFLELAGLAAALPGAAMVVTGEGSFDAHSLSGKLPVAVAALGLSFGVPVVAVAGRCLLPADTWSHAGFADVHALADLDPLCAADSELSRRLLVRVGAALAEEISR